MIPESYGGMTLQQGMPSYCLCHNKQLMHDYLLLLLYYILSFLEVSPYL